MKSMMKPQIIFLKEIFFSTGPMRVQQLRKMSQVAAVTGDASRPDSVKIDLKQINQYMRYLTAGTETDENKPMVVIYGWLMSKEKHYKRIHDFYLRQGFDVLKLQISPRMQLWPVTIKPVVSNMLDYLSSEQHSNKPLLLHGFSVGGYMYADTIYTILQNPDKYSAVGNRILGHVSDSPVDVMGAAIGISRAVTDSKILQKFIEKSIDSYLTIFKKQCTNYMMIASRMYKENPLRIPTLYLYSRNDAISALEPIHYSIKRQRMQNIPHFYHEFDSQHVEHFRRHPEVYGRLLGQFFDFIKIKDRNYHYENNIQEKIASFSM